MKKLLFISFMFFAMVIAGNCNAQSTRVITGIILNQAGEPVRSAKISLSDSSEKATLSDSNGKFELREVPFERVEIRAQHTYSHTATVVVAAGTKDRKIQIILIDRLIGLPELDVYAYRSRTPFVEASYSGMKVGIPTMQFPGSIEVLAKRKLDEQQVVSFTEAMRNISGVSNASAGEPNNVSEVFVSRGFALGNSRNYFRDGMRYRKVASMPMVGIDRIEFLRGPASVLYGTVEPGGIVNVITSPTLFSPKYSATLRIGSYGLRQAVADLTGPITTSKRIRYRLNAMYEYADSYRKPVSSLRMNISPKVDIDISSRTVLGLRANYFSDDRIVDPGIVHQNGEIVPNGDRLFVAEPWAKSRYYSLDTGYTLKHEFNDNWKWNSQFSYTKLSEDRLYFQMKDIKGDLMNRRLAKWDAEISYYTLQNDLIGKFRTASIEHQVLIGTEYEYSHNERKVKGDTFAPISLTNPNYTDKPAGIDSYKLSTDMVINQNNFAVYAQDFMSLTRHLRLLLGGRFDWIRKTNQNKIKDVKTGASPFAFSPRVALMYNPLEHLGIHASYTTSYIPTSGQTKEGTPFEPVRTKQWEFGFKKILFGNSTIATLSLYHMTKSNLLTPDLDDPQFKIQIGEHYSRGVELAINSRVTRQLMLEMNYAYTEGEVSKTNDKKIPVGSKLANIPSHRFNLWASYSLYDGILSGLSFGGGCFVNSKSFGNTTNTITLPGYATADMFVSYAQKNYKLALNVKNLTDKRYYLGAQGNNLLTPGTPRSFVFSTTVTF